MLWLFGEIWLWLLAAFVLGLALAGLTFYSLRRRSAAGDETATDTTAPVPRVSDSERTTLMRRVEPGAAAPSHGDRTDESEGRVHGVLPLSSAEWHARNEWPDERDIALAEENRPRRQS
ncbi:hypothetical protein [Saccharomonospora sp. NB11]|jgi:hypothetical protein|uniref:hypothetical protein n=1 Tax=Saccharomonospora sp. NB11 TaxID=1642298 RepID=UPI0018D1066A|nr:hypothetical protein [Saccharomonospora sp. NB11]